MDAGGCSDLDSPHDGGPQLAADPNRSVPDERQGSLPDDDRHVLPAGPAGRKNSLQRFPAQTIGGHVLQLRRARRRKEKPAQDAHLASRQQHFPSSL